MAIAEPDKRRVGEASSGVTAGTPATGFDTLDLAAIAYLALPVLIFLVGWLNWWLGLPLAVLLLVGLRGLWPVLAAPAPPVRIRWGLTAFVVVVAVAWSALGGAGHLFFSNFDWLTRDLVLRDLVVGSWPVGYGSVDGDPLLLRAPIGYYLPAAIAGKILGLGAADLALLIWTALGVALFLGLAASRETRWPAAVIIVTTLVLFSGMDAVGTVLRGGFEVAINLRPTDHLEWWGRRYQFSSHTTQLFWVPNHALPGWIATALLVRHAHGRYLIGLLPMLVALLPLWSPLTAIGFMPLAAVWWLRRLAQERSLDEVNPLGLVAALALTVATGSYLVMGAGSIPLGGAARVTESLGVFLPHYLQFVLLEVGILWLLLLAVRKDLLLVVAGVALWLLPLAWFGPSNDLAMRGSIPALVVVALAAAGAIAHPARAMEMKVFYPVLLILMLGMPTAVTEIIRSVSEPVWRPDYSHSLVPDPARDYPPHYATLMKDGFVALLLRPVNDVNDLRPKVVVRGGENQ